MGSEAPAMYANVHCATPGDIAGLIATASEPVMYADKNEDTDDMRVKTL